MPDTRRSFVFDTNFIIQNKNLNEVIENLNKNGFSAYVTQVAIDERIAQECVKQKGKYEKLASLSKDTKDFATITIDKEYEEVENTYKTGMQKKYVEHFDKNIIPYSQDAEMFSKILRRAFMKIPPFITSGTDKGFKDSLMWLSMLDFFKTNGEDEIVFVSNDNGFKENATALCKEFKEATGKAIEIKDNSYYKGLLDKDEESEEKHVSESLPDFAKMPTSKGEKESVTNIRNATQPKEQIEEKPQNVVSKPIINQNPEPVKKDEVVEMAAETMGEIADVMLQAPIGIIARTRSIFANARLVSVKKNVSGALADNPDYLVFRDMMGY